MKIRSLATVAIAAIAALLLSDIGPAFAADSVSTPSSTASVDQTQTPAPTPTSTATPEPITSPVPSPTPTTSSSPSPSPSPATTTAPWTLTPLAVTTRDVIIQAPQGSLPALQSALASVGLNPEFTYTKAIYGVAVTATSVQLNALQAAVPGLIISDQVEYKVTDTVPNAPWNLSMLDDSTYPPDSTYTYPASAGAGVKVYVIDTGVKPNPGQFVGSRLAPGADFTNSGTTSDCAGHGTHVAGTIGSDSYGVAKKVTIVPLHALAAANDCTGGGQTSNVIAAINWAIQDNPAGKRAVINMSLGPSVPSGRDSAMDTAINNAINDGIVVVVAAGNSGNSLVPSFREACGYSPANSPGTLTVGAVDTNGDEANFSNYGSCVSLFAPGVDIRSLDYTNVNGSALMNGTSMATPHVAGAVALYIAEHPTDTPAQIRQAILDSALSGKVGFYAGHSGSPNLLLNISGITQPTLTNTAPVTLTVTGGTPGGKPKVGGSISAVAGTWTSTASVTRSYQWFTCDTAKTASTTSLPSDCSQIPNELTNRLSVTSAMAYKHILSAETATASPTTATVYSASQGPVAIPPSIITDPEVSGNARVGEILSVTDGTWEGSPAPTFTYRWYACASPVVGAANSLDSSKGCVIIANATDATFTLQSAQLNKYVIAEVRALNETVATAVSRFTTGVNQVTQAPLNTVSPALTLAANPGADGKPRFTGTASTSTRLTTSTGTWTGTPTITYQYKWYSCPTAVAASSTLQQDCLEIAMERASSYTVTSADVGRTVLSEVIATNGLASVSAFSASTVSVGQPPRNLFAPSISSSGVRVGDVLTGDDGTWDGADALTRQWFACSATTAAADGAPAASPALCVAIPSATAQSFTLTSAQLGKFIVFEVRATNASGGSVAVKKSSAATVAVTAVPVNTVSPVISVGTPSAANSTPRYAGVGNPSTPLTVSRGTWTGTPTITYSYEWYRCDTAISATRVAPDGCSEITAAANQTTYTVTADDAGKFISAAVIATNGAGEAVKFSASTAAVATSPVNTGAPEIASVEPFVGNALDARNGTWGGTPTPTYSYAWFSCASIVANSGATLPSGCVAITGATSARFVIPSSLIGKYFVARVTATNAAVTSATAPVRYTASTTATAKQGPAITFTLPGANGAPRFTGVATTSSLLTASNGTWDGTGVTTYAYEWYSCNSSVAGSSTLPTDCTVIPGAATNTFRVNSAQSGKYISAAVSATNSLGTRKSWSPSTAQVTTPPANTASPSITGAAYVGRTVTANPGTWTGTPDPSYSYKWYSCASTVVSSLTTVPGGCVLIAGAAASTYLLPATQANKFLVVSVTALNGAIAAPGVTKFSVSSAKVLTEPTNSSAARISSSSSAGSSPISGSRLTAVPGTWTGSPTISLSYEWYTCATAVAAATTSKPDQCDFISGATSSTFTVTDDLAGTFITVAETALNPASSKTQWSAVSASVVTRPVRDSDPTISGDAVAGSTITAVAGSVTATPAAQSAFAWFACPSGVTPTSTVPSGCVQRTSATGLTYVLTTADAGLFVTARETATNVAGSSIRFSASTTIVKAPPANSSLNAVTVGTAAASGAPRVGGSVSTDSGTWSGYPAPTLDRQWFRCASAVTQSTAALPGDCQSIDGEIGPSYTPTVDDIGFFVTVQITASNDQGQSVRVAPSGALAVVEVPDVVTDPVLSDAHVVGDTLTLSPGEWRGTPTPSKANSWYRCNSVVPAAASTLPADCVVISDGNATATTRVLSSADLGKFIVGGIRASSTAGAKTRYTASTESVASRPTVTAAPTVSGNPWVGKTLTTTTGSFAGTPLPTKSYKWYSCDQSYPAGSDPLPSGCQAIDGATNSSLVVPDLLDTQFIMFEVTATNSAGSVSSRSATTSNVRHIPLNTEAQSLTGNAIADRGSITTTRGTWSGSPTLNYAYSWFACTARQADNSATLPTGCIQIVGMTQPQLTLTSAQVGKYVISGVTVTNQTESVSRYSASTTIVASDPVYVSGMAVSVPSPATNGAPRAGFNVLAVAGTWKGTPAPTYTYQWYLCAAVQSATASNLPDGCDVVSGKTTDTLPITADMAGLFPLVRITGSNVASSADVFSPTTSKAVTVPPTETEVPSLTGPPFVSATLTAKPGLWAGTAPIGIAYAWYSCTTAVQAVTTAVPSDCVKILNETKSTLKLTAAMKTKNITAAVTASNIAGAKTILTVSKGPVTTGAANTVAPTVTTTGVARVGGLVTLNRGTWVGEPTPLAADDRYQWFRCRDEVTASSDALAENCFEIFDKTETTYTLTSDDADMFVVAAVTGHNSNGESTVVTKSTARVLVPPTNTESPVVTGRPFARTQLSTTDGTWAGTPDITFTYQWQACTEAQVASRSQQPANCTDIANAKQPTFTPGDDEVGDYILVKVTGHNGAGDTPTWSATTDIIASGPVNKIAPVVTVVRGSSTGLPIVGGAVTTTGGTWIGRPTPSKRYQWMRCATAVTTPSAVAPGASANCSNIENATSDTYSLVADDRSAFIMVKVTGFNDSGEVDHYSATTAAVTMAPVNQVAPTVGGVVFMQGTARAKSDDWQAFPAITRTYAWYVCDAPIQSDSATAPTGCSIVAGAEANTYTVPTTQSGKYLVVKVTATNTVGSGVRFSATSRQIVAGPVNLVDPVVSGKAQVGKPPLTVSDGNWTPQGPSLSYQWYRCGVETATAIDELDASLGCVEITGDDSSVHEIVPADSGKALIAGVTATNSLGTSTRFTKSTALVTEFPSITTDPSITGLPEVDGTLTLNDGVWRGFPALTVSYSNWFWCTTRVLTASNTKPAGCTEIPGAKGQTFTPSGPDAAGKGGQLGKYILYGVTKFNTIDGVKTSLSRYTASTDVVSQPASLTAKPYLKTYIRYVSDTNKTARPSDKNPQVGDALVLTSTWKDPQPTKTYQWLRCENRVDVPDRMKDAAPAGCVVIAGAESSTYTLVIADKSKFIVGSAVGTNSVGTTQEYSNSTIDVQLAPTVVVMPSVSGDRFKNRLLTANPGQWDGTPLPDVSYLWYSCTAPVPADVETVPSTCVGNGETGSTYLQSASGLDDGKYITVRVTATNPSGTKAFLLAVTEQQATASLPVNTALPEIELTKPDTGFPVGSSVHEVAASWRATPAAHITYQWYSCTSIVLQAASILDPSCSEISAADPADVTGAEYHILSSDLGKYLLVKATGSNAAGSDSRFSASTSKEVSQTVVNVVPVDIAVADGITRITPSHPVVTVNGIDGSWRDKSDQPISSTTTDNPHLAHFWVFCDSPVDHVLTYLPDQCGETEEAVSSSRTFDRLSPYSGQYIAYAEVVFETFELLNGGTRTRRLIRLSKTTPRIMEAPSLWEKITGVDGRSLFTPPSVPFEMVVGTAVTATPGSWPATSPAPVTTTTWRGTESGTFTYQWFSCDAAQGRYTTAGLPSGCSDITNANRPSFTPTGNETRLFVGVRVTATNSLGSTQVWTGTTVRGVSEEPSIDNDPVITGDNIVGATLTMSDGTWRGFPEPSKARTWYACTNAVASAGSTLPSGCSLISSQRGATLALTTDQGGKYIVGAVAASNQPRSNAPVVTVTRYTASTAKISERPVSVVAPVLSGVANVGSSLSMTQGTWKGTPTPDLSYRWFSCDSAPAANSATENVADDCTLIAGKTASVLPLTASYTGKFIVGQIKATNSATTDPGTGAPLSPPNGPRYRATVSSQKVLEGVANTGAPTLSTEDAVDQTITASSGTWSGSQPVTFSYQWFACTNAVYAAVATAPTAAPPTGAGCTAISGATAQTFKLTSSQSGKHVIVQVKASNTLNGTPPVLATATKTSISNGPIRQAPTMSLAPTTSGVMHVGETASTTTGNWLGFPAPTKTYDWYICPANVPVAAGSSTIPQTCSLVQGASNQPLVIPANAAGNRLVAFVSASNSVVPAGVSRSSATTVLVTSTPANSVAPVVSGASAIANGTNTVTTTTGTWTGSPSPFGFAYAWYTCTGAVAADDALTSGCTLIAGQTTATLTLRSQYAGLYIISKVTARSTVNKVGAGEASYYSSSFGVVTTAPSTASVPSITGSATSGSSLQANVGTWAGYTTPTVTYEWFACPSSTVLLTPVTTAPSTCASLDAADNAPLALDDTLVGKKILLLVTATNPSGTTKKSSLLSATVGALAPLRIATLLTYSLARLVA